MARALGSKVYAAPEKEIGWAPLQLTEAGKNSPLKHLGLENTPVLHWHGETFDIPDGAVRLASTSAVPNQAFSWKKKGLALQFHPEVTVHGMERWFIGHQCEIETTENISIQQLRADTQKYGYEMDAYACAFLDDWLESIC
jgi:GMP synthase (glutamine-hydrolysing)